MSQIIDFRVDPNNYRHWRVEYDGAIANLYMDVDEDGGLFDGYQLKLNSYDLGVDIELNDIVQRMRFEHPEVKVVVMRSAKDKVSCAGPLDRCDVFLAAFFFGGFKCISGFIREFAEVHLVTVRGPAQHPNIGSCAKHFVLC